MYNRTRPYICNVVCRVWSICYKVHQSLYDYSPLFKAMFQILTHFRTTMLNVRRCRYMSGLLWEFPRVQNGCTDCKRKFKYFLNKNRTFVKHFTVYWKICISWGFVLYYLINLFSVGDFFLKSNLTPVTATWCLVRFLWKLGMEETEKKTTS